MRYALQPSNQLLSMTQHALPNSLRTSDTGCYEHSSDEVCTYDGGHVADISDSDDCLFLVPNS
jgi:hypothetical protein